MSGDATTGGGADNDDVISLGRSLNLGHTVNSSLYHFVMSDHRNNSLRLLREPFHCPSGDIGGNRVRSFKFVVFHGKTSPFQDGNNLTAARLDGQNVVLGAVGDENAGFVFHLYGSHKTRRKGNNMR